MEFSELGLPNALIENLSVFNEPTPIQMQSIPISLKRRDLLATAPTGSFTFWTNQKINLKLRILLLGLTILGF